MITAKLEVSKLPQARAIRIPLPLRTSKEYPFVNLVRFLSMIGIVWAHTDLAPFNSEINSYLGKLGHMEYYILFKQVFKFAVLCFFMISGFLLGEQLDKTSSLNYLKKRLESTLKPFLLASSLFVIALLAKRYLFDKGEFNTVADILRFTFFTTMFWYLPNYLICLFTLLVFRSFLKSFSFGLVLLAINICYTVLTVYDKELVAPHTDLTAVFSYLFYLWLGVYIAQNNWIDKIMKLNPLMLFGIVVMLFLLSSFESYVLYQKQMGYFNILRFGNQAYGIAMFVFLVRICSQQPHFWKLNPRKESYGIYLYHGFFSLLVFPKLLKWASEKWNINWFSDNMGSYLLSILIYFIAIYIATVMLVKVLKRFNLAYL